MNVFCALYLGCFSGSYSKTVRDFKCHWHVQKRENLIWKCRQLCEKDRSELIFERLRKLNQQWEYWSRRPIAWWEKLYPFSVFKMQVNQSEQVRIHDELESARVHWIANALYSEGKRKRKSGNLLWNAYYLPPRPASVGSFVSTSDSVTVNGPHQTDTKFLLWNVWANKVSSAHVKPS